MNNSTRTYLSLLLSEICIRSATTGKRPREDMLDVIEKLGKIEDLDRVEHVAERLYYTLIGVDSLEEFVTKAKRMVREI